MNDILEDLHALRESYAAQFEYDLERIFDDLKSREANNPASRAGIQPVRRARS